MKCLFLFFLSIQLYGLISQEGVVMGTGAACVDLLVQIDDAFLEEVAAGHKGGGIQRTPEEIASILANAGKSPQAVPGGSSANTIRALAKLRQPTAFLGYIANDQWGNIFSQNFIDLGVDTRLGKALFTSHILCLITPDAERTFLAALPPIENFDFSPNDLVNVRWLHLEARSLFYPGYIEKLVKLASSLKIPISIDLSSFEIVRHYKETLLHLLTHYVNIVFCNEDEITALTNLNPQAGCLALQEICPLVVVTLGKNGCLVGSEQTVTAFPAFPTTVLDTTGAGDYFAAGFLYGHLHQLPLKECARIGNRLGSAVIEEIGAELPEHKWNFLREFILTCRKTYATR